MYGIDGSFWAGDYGPWYRAPTFQLNGGPNLVYNPEFGPYNGITAQGWTANPGFGACQGAWGGSNPCIVNSDGVPGQSTVGLVANQNGGGPSATGGTTSGQPGGYNSTMSVTYAGAGTGTAQTPPPTPTPNPTNIYSTSSGTVRITNIWPTSNNSPAGEGERSQHQYHRYEDAGDAVGQPLDRGARSLCLAHQAHDARERGGRADAGGTHPQRAGAVDRAGEHRIATAARHRDALPGQHALVDRGAAIDHFAVDRERFSRA